MVKLNEARWYDHIRFVLSSLLLLFSTIVTCYAIVMQKTVFWDTVPGWAALIIFIVCLFCLGVVEGLQIALVELKRQHPDTYKVSHPRAYKLGQLAGRGDNTERFLMGRQVFVVLLVFFAAKMTTIHPSEDGEFLFPIPEWFRASMLETGFLACLLVVIVAQLMPQIVAALYPVHFLQLLVMWPAYWICIAVETTGLTHACWLLSWLFSKAMRIDESDEEVLEKVKVGETDGKMRDIEKILDERTEDSKGSFQQLAKELEIEVDPNTLAVLKLYLHNHPEKYQQYPSVVGGKSYAPPQAIAQKLQDKGLPIPAFLTSVTNKEHVPPHIVACRLLDRNQELEREASRLRKFLGDVDSFGGSSGITRSTGSCESLGRTSENVEVEVTDSDGVSERSSAPFLKDRTPCNV